MATASTFSYAQAAKGQAATNPSTQPSGTNNVGSTSEVQDSATDNTHSAPTDASNAADVKAELNGTDAAPSSEIKETKEDASRAQDSNTAPPSNNQNPRSSATSMAGSRREDDDANTEGSSRRSEKGAGRSPSSSTRVADDGEGKKAPRKSRKGKGSGDADKNKDKEPEKEKEQPKVELYEAPIPSVNIWAQRKEAQAASTKVAKPVLHTTSASSRGGATAAPGSADTESKRKAKGTDAANAASDSPGTNSHSKAQGRSDESRGDGETTTTATTATRRSGPRGSRTADKSASLPPVGDVGLWPTPETAVKEEKKKPAEKPGEKVEQAETTDENGAPRSKKKEQWERIDFVPTVNWETHIPAPRGSRGGRAGPGSRPGREASSRSHNAQTTSASDKSADAAANATTASVPTATAPASSTSSNNNSSSSNNNNNSNPAAAKGGSEQREKQRGEGAASGRANSLPPASRQSTSDAPRPSRDQRRSQGPNRAERARDSTNNSSSEQASTRGEGRPERGRGGLYRGGRGGHAASGTSHAQQNSYMGNGNQFAPQQPMPRHHYSSPPLSQGNGHFQGFGPSQNRSTGRGGRGQGGSGFSSRANGPNGNASRPRPLSTAGNFSPYQWDQYGPAPLTAPPYPAQPHMAFEHKSVLINQIEYYFSVDNLCKDSHLRSHMDSQGFVFLSMISDFNRIKQLTYGQYAPLKQACMDLTLCDFVAGSDGIERIRARHHWQKFLLPLDARHESAKTPGPDNFFTLNPDMSNAHSAAMPDAYGASLYMNGFGAQPVYMNGAGPTDANGQLSATVPEFQPVGFGGDSSHGNVSGPASSVNGTHVPNGTTMVNGTHEESQPADSLQS